MPCWLHELLSNRRFGAFSLMSNIHLRFLSIFHMFLQISEQQTNKSCLFVRIEQNTNIRQRNHEIIKRKPEATLRAVKISFEQ
jgi:hypothetical protein